MNTQANSQTIEKLTDIVARAVSRLQTDGASGWGLNNPDESIFELVEIDGASGCTSSTCRHWSHDPAAPMYKAVPRRQSARLACLGTDQEGDELAIDYYVLIDGDDVKFYRLEDPGAYWAQLREVEADDVPEWALAQLAK